MNTRMPLGVDDFKEARTAYYLVDKTEMIAQLLDDHAKVTLFTRPRRFGKTLAMSMLEYFFSIEKKEETAHLFDGMAIDRAGARYMAERGRYPVIFLTLKGVQDMSWEGMYQSFLLFIRMEYQKHRKLLESVSWPAEDQEYIDRIIEGSASPQEYGISLLRLCGFLYRACGVPPIILLDEYDAPIQCAYDHGFYDKAISYFRTFYNNTLKSNPYLSFAVLTGVLRIAKESIFSGLNNLSVCSVLSHAYQDAFGFTEEDVNKLARDLALSAEQKKTMKEWYDGYSFGGVDIYNPWSVINYAAHGCRPMPYWVNTSGNSILKSLLPKQDETRAKTLEDLLQGGTVKTTVRESTIYETIGGNRSALYSMLLTTGYLTAASGPLSTYDRYALRIPNQEIREVYRSEILDHLADKVDQDRFYTLFEALLSGDAEEFEDELSYILLHVVSAFDAGGKENFYHGFMLGMTALFLGRDYTVESNRESGYGRFDLAIFPKEAGKAGVLMEFKAAENEEDLPAKAEEALRQIHEKEYDAAFTSRGVTKVWKYGIAFAGKRMAMKWNGGNDDSFLQHGKNG